MNDMHDWQDAEHAVAEPGPVHQSEGTASAGGALPEVEATNLPALPPADDTVEAVLARQLSAGISAALAPSVPAVTTDDGTLAVPAFAPDTAAATPKDDLEAGIASVFAALHAARDDAFDASLDAEDGGDAGDSETEAVTFRLLGELDRLWHQSAA